jgi:hypothetical protein
LVVGFLGHILTGVKNFDDKKGNKHIASTVVIISASAFVHILSALYGYEINITNMILYCCCSAINVDFL